jgi:hypothetical protein
MDAAVNYVGILELAKKGVFSEGHRYLAYVGSCDVVGGEGVVSWVPGVGDGVKVEPWFERGGLFQKGVYEEVKHVYVDDVMTATVPSAARVALVFVSLGYWNYLASVVSCYRPLPPHQMPLMIMGLMGREKELRTMVRRRGSG